MVKMGIWEEKKLFLIHIREYYGYFEPAKKGISLTKQ
jgi:hypothetical protein